MAAAAIRIDQPGHPSQVVGRDDRSRDDLALGVVRLRNANDIGVRTWRWSFIDIPDESNAELSNPVSAAPEFTADVPGSYFVQLIVNEGASGEVSKRLAIIRDADGLRIPAAREQDEANYDIGGEPNRRGWYRDIRQLFEAVHTAVPLALTPDADNTVVIQNAIDAANAAGGGVVNLPPGTYRFSSITLRSNVDLVSLGGTILKVNDHISDQNDNIPYYFVRADAQSNIVLRGITFDGTQATNRPVSEGASWVADILTIVGDRIRVIDCTFIDAADSGVMFAQCTNSEVRGCYFDNCPDLGVYYNDTGGGAALNNLIADNRFTRCQFGAIGIKREASSVTVECNTIRDCGNGITLEDFGGGVHPERCSIIGNRLEHIGHSYTGVGAVAKVGIAANAAHGCLIEGNLLDDVIGPGIALDGADHCIVQGNRIYNTASGLANNRGITLNPRNSQGCRHNLIKGNVVTGSRSHAFAALSGTGDHQYNLIEGNDFAAAVGAGIRIDAANFLDNDVAENRLQGSTFDLDINISSGTAVRNRWTNNRLMTPSRNGFVDVQTASIVADYGTRRVAVGTAVPTVGAWSTGDLVFNTSPGADTPMLWECTAGGTPGTWLGKKGIPLSGALTLLGNLQLLTASQRIDFGDGVTAGNVTARWNKADVNNMTLEEFYSAAVFQWLLQLDSSENLNWLDAAAAIVLQLQRTGGFVRAANGFRVGPTNGPLLTAPAQVVTTDATVTTLATVSLTSLGQATEIRAVVVGMQSDGSNRNAYERQALVFRAGGGATLQGAVATPRTEESAAGWDCTIDVSGNDARVRVTGAAATTVNWRGYIERIEVT